MAGGAERDGKGVKRARSDIAEYDAERGEREKPDVAPMMHPSGAPITRRAGAVGRSISPRGPQRRRGSVAGGRIQRNTSRAKGLRLVPARDPGLFKIEASNQQKSGLQPPAGRDIGLAFTMSSPVLALPSPWFAWNLRG